MLLSCVTESACDLQSLVAKTYAFFALPVYLQGSMVHCVNELFLHVRRPLVLDGVLDCITESLTRLQGLDRSIRSFHVGAVVAIGFLVGVIPEKRP